MHFSILCNRMVAIHFNYNFMKKYFAVVVMTVLLSGCQNSASPANTIPTQQTGARATIHITRTQEDAIETQEDDTLTEEISLNENNR